MQKKKTNIVLIGMAGAGKSTVGRALAKQLNCSFVDTDNLIEETQGLPLQKVLDTLGPTAFRQVEEQVLLAIKQKNHIIATGGSAIYSDAGMAHLKQSALLIFLDVPLETLQQRVGNFSSRGVVKAKNQSFTQLFEERLSLYNTHADHIIHCQDKSVDTICQCICDLIK